MLNTAARPQGVGGVDAADVVARYARGPADLAALLAMLYDEPTRPRAGRPPGPRKPCGTIQAYHQHINRGESTEGCGCRDANNAYRAGRVRKAADLTQARTRRRNDCGTNKGYHRHLYWGETTCGACRAAHAEQVRVSAARKRALLRGDTLGV